MRSPTIISCYVNSLRNSYLTEALYALVKKNAEELVESQKSLNSAIKPIPQGIEIQNGDTGKNKDLPPGWGVGP